MNLFGVVTTIQQPTECMRRLAERLQEADAPLIVIGDRKGPQHYDVPGARLLTLQQQLEMPLTLAELLPTDHYARKNLGYLEAMRCGGQCIYETDDDNAPNEQWNVRALSAIARKVTPRPWCNVYRLFSDEQIWPRGFPLALIRQASSFEEDAVDADSQMVNAPVQQGLADRSPDVDAIWRLANDEEISFQRSEGVFLPPGTCCPFNSQSTWWWPAAYPLMYLPSYCSFRMTDIWRSFIAQRCLWAMDLGVVFHTAEVEQERNVHDLMSDFELEIPGYLGNEKLVVMLRELELDSDAAKVCDNLLKCYERLVAGDFFPESELPLVQAWLSDIGRSQ